LCRFRVVQELYGAIWQDASFRYLVTSSKGGRAVTTGVIAFRTSL